MFRFFLLLLLAYPLCGAEHVWQLLLPWQPQAQFAGVYIAEERGFFAQRGVKVQLEHSFGLRDGAAALEPGSPEMVILPLSDALKACNDGQSLTNLLQINQNSNVALVVRRKSGIHTPDQLATTRPDGNKRRIAIWEYTSGRAPELFLKRKNIHAELLPISGSVDLFLWEAVDAISVMEYNEFYTLLATGLRGDELVKFRLRDDGLNIPEDGLYTTTETFERYPEDCRKIADAILEGWIYASTHKKEAVESVRNICETVHHRFDLAHQRWMLATFLNSLGLNDPSTRGKLSRFNYDTAVRLMKRAGMVDRVPGYDAFCPARETKK